MTCQKDVIADSIRNPDDPAPRTNFFAGKR